MGRRQSFAQRVTTKAQRECEQYGDGAREELRDNCACRTCMAREILTLRGVEDAARALYTDWLDSLGGVEQCDEDCQCSGRRLGRALDKRNTYCCPAARNGRAPPHYASCVNFARPEEHDLSDQAGESSSQDKPSPSPLHAAALDLAWWAFEFAITGHSSGQYVCEVCAARFTGDWREIPHREGCQYETFRRAQAAGEEES